MTFEDDERAFLERMYPDRSKEQERFREFAKVSFQKDAPRISGIGDRLAYNLNRGWKDGQGGVVTELVSDEPLDTGTDTVTKAGGTEMADRRFGAATGLKVRADSKAEDAMSRGDDAKVRSEGAKAEGYGAAADQALSDMNSDESNRMEKSEGAMAAGGSNATASDSGAFNTRYSSKKFDDFVSTPMGSPREYSQAPDHPGAPDTQSD